MEPENTQEEKKPPESLIDSFKMTRNERFISSHRVLTAHYEKCISNKRLSKKRNIDLEEEQNSPLDEGGYVYVIWFFGECYKIGSCTDVGRRAFYYERFYEDDLEFKYISNININYKKLKKMVHFKLDEFRVRKGSAFFKTDINYIISVIEDIENNIDIKKK